MKKAIRAFSLILAAVFVIIAVASCTTSDPSHTGENSGADVTSGEPKVEKYGNVPLSDKSKFEGKEFLIATYLDGNVSNGWACYFDVDEPEEGDKMQEGSHRRNLEIEETFGVKITCDELWHWWGGKEGYFYLVNLMEAGDSIYNLFFLESYIPHSDLVIEGLLYDMGQLPYIDLSADYYNHSYNETYCLGGKYYILASDLTYPCQSAQRVYVNIDMLKDLQYDENYAYDLVDNGGWTYDVLLQMINGQSEDLNQDGKMDVNDYYGFAGTPYSATGFFHGSGLKGSYISENGWEFDYDSDRAIRIMDAIYGFVNKPEVYVKEWTNEIFNSGRALFTTSGSELREIKNWDLSIHIGVLPYPKFDDTQDRYYCYCAGGNFCVPSDIKDTEFTGAMIDAMSYGSQKYLVPAFYDNFIQQRVLQDDRSRENWRRMRGEWGLFELAGHIAPNEEVRYYNPVTKVVAEMSTGGANNYMSRWAEQRDVMQLVCNQFYKKFMSKI
ncbi:MAG: hypothetical protein J5830_00235 [Clostridia bacterium]|nr:hypothetical protein [Clostridia bacterium]